MKTRLLSGGRRWRLAGLISNALVQAGAALAGAMCMKVLIDNLLLARDPQVTTTTWLMVGGFTVAHAVLSGLKVLSAWTPSGWASTTPPRSASSCSTG